MRTSLLSCLAAPLLLALAAPGAAAPAPSAPLVTPAATPQPQPQGRVQSSRAGSFSRASSSSGRSSFSRPSSGFSRPSSSGHGVSSFQGSARGSFGSSRPSSPGPVVVPRSSSPSPTTRGGWSSPSSSGWSSPNVRVIPDPTARGGSGGFSSGGPDLGTRYPAGTGVGEGVDTTPPLTRYTSPGAFGGASVAPGSDGSPAGGWNAGSPAVDGSPVIDLRSPRAPTRVRFPAPYRPTEVDGGLRTSSGSPVITRWTPSSLGATPGSEGRTSIGSSGLVERYRGATGLPTHAVTPVPLSVPGRGLSPSAGGSVRVGPSRAYRSPGAPTPSARNDHEPSPGPGGLTLGRPSHGGAVTGATGPAAGRTSHVDSRPVRAPARPTAIGGAQGGGVRPSGGSSAGGTATNPATSYGNALAGLDELHRRDPGQAGRIVLTGNVVAHSIGVMGAVATAAVGGLSHPTWNTPPYGGAVRPGTVTHFGGLDGHGHHGGWGYPWGVGSCWNWGRSWGGYCYGGWWWPSYWWWTYPCSWWYWQPYYQSYPVYCASVIYREVEVDRDPTVVVVNGGSQPVGEAVVQAPAQGEGSVPALSGRNSLAVATQRYLDLGDQAFRDGRYADAVQFYAKAVEFSPEQGDLYLVLADSLFAAGDYHYAAFAIRRAFQIDGSLASAPVDKHDFYPDPTEFDRELAVLEQYLADHPTDQDARLVLATNELFGRRPAAAVDLLSSSNAAGFTENDPAAELVLKTARQVQYGAPADGGEGR